MFTVLLSWLYILFITLSLGLCAHLMWEKVSGVRFSTPEAWILTGLSLSAVYAQLFSLFMGIGACANILLLLICAALLVRFRKDIAAVMTAVRGRLVPGFPPKGPGSVLLPALRVLLVLALVIFTALVTAQKPTHYDTYLYHAQAIRWIEEYGCVPGLGNLHNRFAYNSSFLVLQALFSLRFIAGSSLHTLNGFIGTLLLAWSVWSMRLWRRRGLFVSDGLRAGLIYYLLHNSTVLSSPNTDTFALSLAFYIFIKWCELLEERTEAPGHVAPWAYLCLLSVFACTLKLSSAFLLVLLVKPLGMLARGRRRENASGAAPGRQSGSLRQFGFCILCAAVLTLPYFIRNVLISGYLLYPYSALDLFSFADWKMSAGVLDYDRLEITAWGRAVYDVTLLDQPLTQWLPNWFLQQSPVAKREILCAAVSAAGLILTGLVQLLRAAASHVSGKKAPGTGDRKDSAGSALPDRLLLSLAALVCLFGWLFSAPLVRYGEVYLLIVSALFLLPVLKAAGRLFSFHAGTLLPAGSADTQRHVTARTEPHPALPPAGNAFSALALLLVLLRTGMMQPSSWPEGLSPRYQDYLSYDCEEVLWEDLTIYIAPDVTQTGYDPFPAILTGETLSGIELRGEDLSDGFRLKE